MSFGRLGVLGAGFGRLGNGRESGPTLPAPTLIDLTAASDTGSSSTDNITSDTTPDFIIDFGTPPLENDVIEIRSNGSLITSHTITAGEAGSLNITLGTTLSAGSNSITARHVRGALSGTSSALVITIDTTGPTISTSATANVAENSVLSVSLTADETVTWSLTGGADQAKFEISGTTLRWASNGTKNFETPDDADANNTYVVQVTATDVAGNATNKTITVTVTDVAEGIAFDWVSQASQTADSSPFTTGSLSFGAADANRIILVGVGSRHNSTSGVASMTIGGVAATQVPSAAANIPSVLTVDWWYAAVPTGTTGVVAVTFNSAPTRAKVEVYRIVSATGTPSSAATPQTNASGNSLSHSVTVPSGGAAASMYFNVNPVVSNDITWSNAVKDDTSILLEGFTTIGSAKVAATATVGASITSATTGQVGLASVAWGP